MSEVPPGVPYNGPSGIARNSIWLTNEDLPHDRDTQVEIEAVVRRDNVSFQMGRKEPVVLSLRFVAKKRELALNATNRKRLQMLTGSSKCGDWVGARIILFVEQGVRRPDGTTGPAVRIRPKFWEAKEEPREPGGDG